MAKKGDARRHEILVLVFGAKETLVDLGEESFQPHGQEEKLEQAETHEPIMKHGQTVQNDEDDDIEVDAAPKGFRFEPLVWGILERPPEGGVQTGEGGDDGQNKSWHDRERYWTTPRGATRQARCCADLCHGSQVSYLSTRSPSHTSHIYRSYLCDSALWA